MQPSHEALCAERLALLRPPRLAAPKEEEEGRRRKMNGNNNLNMLSSPPPSRWRKGELIGSGAFGRVYMGMNLDSGELFAVKQVLIAANSVMKEKAQAHIRELEEEVRLLRNLSHPNIVRYLGTAQEEEALNIFLELVPGGSISSLLGKFGSFPEPVLRMYTKQLLQGLEYLHRNSIMHRDIKGANILVDNKGCIKLADFGASKQVAELVTMTGAKSMKGTPYWMAPEVIRQTGHGLSADIWSVGCTIIEMATGKPPWSQQFQEVAALFHIGTTMSHPPIPEHLSSEAKNFLLKCLQKEPHLRPTASELLQDPFIVESSEGRLSRQRQISPSQSQDLFQSYDKRSLHISVDYRPIRESGFNPMHEPTSYNPMCEPVEVEGNGWGLSLEEVKSGLEVDMMNEPRKSEAEAEFSFQYASANADVDADADEVTESKIKTFLDEKALELKRLQTPLCEEFQSMWKVATGQSGVLKSPALAGRHVRSNSRSPSSGPPSSPMGASGTCDSITSVVSGSPGGVNLSNSPLGVDASPQESQQRSPGSSERHKAWKEELQRELEEKREERRTLSRLGGNGKASSPNSNSKSNSPNEKNGQRHVARRLSGLASSPSFRSKRD